jgi:multidrug resistance efflux pump
VFNWVRLAQRIPIRIHIDEVPPGVQLAAGMTCSIAVGPATDGRGPKGMLVSWLHELL